MCTLYLRVQCSDTNSEVFVDDVERTELTVENVVSMALLEVFDTVLVDNVTVQRSQGPNDGDGE